MGAFFKFFLLFIIIYYGIRIISKMFAIGKIMYTVRRQFKDQMDQMNNYPPNAGQANTSGHGNYKAEPEAAPKSIGHEDLGEYIEYEDVEDQPS